MRNTNRSRAQVIGVGENPLNRSGELHCIVDEDIVYSIWKADRCPKIGAVTA